MRTHVISQRIFFLSASVVLLAAAGQAVGTLQESTSRVKAGANEGDSPFAVDGQLATPGRVPGGTELAAMDLWSGLRQGLAIAGNDPAEPRGNKPRSFVLEFSVRVRNEKEGTTESPMRLSYLELGPGLVRSSLLNRKGEVKATSMRGLDATDNLAHWYRKYSGEGVTAGWIPRESWEEKKERKDLEKLGDLAFDIARISDPDSMRLVEIERREVDEESDFKRGWLKFKGDPGMQLPPNDVEGVVGGRAKTLSSLCAGLEWVQIATPDFRLVAEDMKYRERLASMKIVKRLVFGVDPKTKRPQVVIVSPARNEALLVPGAAVVQCTEWFEHGETGSKARIPGRLFAYEATTQKSAPRRLAFSAVPLVDLYTLDGGSMYADLGPEGFLPK